MQFAAATTSLAVTLGLVVTRPRVGPSLRIGPAPAAAVGVLMMLMAGVVTVPDLVASFTTLARPLVGVVAIMTTTAVAQRLGLLDRLAAGLFTRAGGGPRRLFLAVFALSAMTAALLNNDSAVLLLTPAVVALVRARWPNEPRLVEPFAFAVFMAAGVAPLVLSNPMNMIVAAYAGIGFNAYAVHMAPVALAGSAIAASMLLLVFRRPLALSPSATEPTPLEPLSAAQRGVLGVLAAVLLVCPVVSVCGGEVGWVALAGALASLAIGASASLDPRDVVRRGVAWDIVLFLVLVFVLGTGLRNAGIVARLGNLYAAHGMVTVGVASALGSAVVNNHPMAILNMLALRGVPAAGTREILAALVGGDLGPRLLPMGSLAGLLWLDALRRRGIDVPVGRFFVVGALVTLPALAVSLALLGLL